MARYFVSYNSADKVKAEWIAWTLEEIGHSTVFQAWDFKPGNNFILEMQKAAAKTDATIAVLSSNYLNALYTQPEFAAALRRDPTGEKRILIPIRIAECDLEGLWPQIVYCDLIGLDEAQAAEEVRKAVSDERFKPKTKPSFGGAVASPTAPSTAPVHNLPPENTHFTGRADLLKRLGDTLAGKGGRVALTQAALHGLGGIGKTQTALKYAYDSLDRYCLVWWLRAETEDTLLADLGALADRLGAVGPEVTEAEPRALAALTALEGKTGWLLIYDNALTEQDVAQWLPRSGGAVILTSRAAVWTRARPLDVEVMSPEDAIALICERSGDADGPAADLAMELGYLPLALEQAAAYMAERAVSIARYLELYRQRRGAVLARGKAADYPDTVATTWEISFHAVAADLPAAGQLLNFCAFLAPDDIPLDLLRPGAAQLPSPLAEALADPLVTDDMVAVLRRHSLVRGRDQVLSLHRLVQEVLRTRLGEAAKNWAGHAVRLLRAVYRFKEVDLATWALAERLLPQVEAAAPHAEAAAVEWRVTWYQLDCAGMCMINRGRFEAGLGLRKRALSLVEANLPADDPTLAIALANLAYAYSRAGLVDLALPLAERAVAIREAQNPPFGGSLLRP